MGFWAELWCELTQHRWVEIAGSNYWHIRRCQRCGTMEEMDVFQPEWHPIKERKQ